MAIALLRYFAESFFAEIRYAPIATKLRNAAK